jgi:hypothetical protein
MHLHAGADVYSYAADEDEMVTNPLLSQHLAHWGINMMVVRVLRGGAAWCDDECHRL